jgi:DhnA family fructose-bisphosphate aldolase class Ia
MLEYVVPVIRNLGVCLRMDAGPTRLGQGTNLERIDFTTTVESAVALGVDAVIGNFYVGTENEDHHMARLGKLATDCRRFGMPLIAEVLPVTVLNYHYGMEEKQDSLEQLNKDLCLAARVGAEMGADCIKTHYSGDKDGYTEVTQSIPVPVWLAGGPKGSGSDSDFLSMVTDAAAAGASGVVIGRNVWLRETPKEIIEELCGIFHVAQ